MRTDLVTTFKQLMERSWNGIDTEIRILEEEYNDEDTFSLMCQCWITDYSTERSRARIHYDDFVTDYYYLCHYGSAYALEYSLLYQLVLLDMNGALSQGDGIRLNRFAGIKELSVLSLGCGSLIDLWSLCYAVSRLDSEDQRLFLLKNYTGYDRCNWAIKFDRRYFLKYFEGGLDKRITEHLGKVDGDILNCFGEGVCIDQNIIIFPKIINELDYNLVNTLKNKISKTTFTADTVYVCFSHSYAELVEGMKNAAIIIKAINGYNHVNYNILNINNGEKSDIVRKIYNNRYLDFLTALQLNDHSFVYMFKNDENQSYPCSIGKYDRNLTISRMINNENMTLPQYFRMIGEKHPCIPGVLNYPTGSARAENPVSLVFQIVRLTK